MTTAQTPAVVSADERRRIVKLLNEAMSAEYHSFVGYALSSNPYVIPAWEKDIGVLEGIRDEENDNCRALLAQLGRYRAGPAPKAFRLWKEDLNYLSLEYLVIRAADHAKKEITRIEGFIARLPDDEHMAATFTSILGSKRKHEKELSKLAATREKERDARQAFARQTTAIKVKGLAGPAAAPAAAGAAPKRAPAGGPRPPGAAPRPPGAAPRPPGAAPPPPGRAPKPPGAAPKPPGAAPRPPGAAPKPPGAPKPPSAPRPPGAAPKPPNA